MSVMSVRANFYRFLFLFLAIMLILFFSFIPFVEAQEILPLSQIKPGDKGYGLTVFRGTEPEKFDFEVIDLYHNWDENHYILVLLSGGPKDENGNEILKEVKVLKGMSGSPLFIRDKVIGAIAMAPDFPKESYALVTPIELMLGFRPETLILPNKLIQKQPLTDFITPETKKINAGEMYTFCDYWGSNSLCGSGTVTLAHPQNSNLIFTLGHRAFGIGITALPIWKSRVLGSIPQLSFSSKLVEPVGPMLGAVFFESPYGQVARLGIVPKFFPMSVILEDYFSRKMVNQYFFAYTPRTAGNISSVVMGDKQIIDKILDVDAEIRIDAEGLTQIYSKGAFESPAIIGSAVKMLVGEELNPIIENIHVTLKSRSKYQILDLKKVTLKTTGTNGKLTLDLSITAVGNEEWTSQNSLTIDSKYLGKELHITSGEELVAKILPRLKPNSKTVDLLNKISDRNALYVYYVDPEEIESSESPAVIQLVINNANTLSSNIYRYSPADIAVEPLDKPQIPTNKKEGGAMGWTNKPREYEIDILAKIEPPGSDYLIKGDKIFTPSITDQQKEQSKKKSWKKFLIF